MKKLFFILMSAICLNMISCHTDTPKTVDSDTNTTDTTVVDSVVSVQ